MAFDTAFWRRWHRWISFPAAIFLCFAGVTGVIVASTEFFGEEERLREATRSIVSPVNTSSDANAWSDPLSKAFATASSKYPNAPIDKVTLQYKGDSPTVALFTGKPTGGEDRKLIFDLRTGELKADESYADKPLINRIHSAEAFGDGGLVFAMFWGTILVWLTVSGFIIYLRMRRPGQTGMKKVFW
ncbi:MAG TPA: PepSY domain-containing protein [Gemmatimonadaceae bacterium]|nr:PepSY domain-containing protein [Gemmatimonadaceae bacterium]